VQLKSRKGALNEGKMKRLKKAWNSPYRSILDQIATRNPNSTRWGPATSGAGVIERKETTGHDKTSLGGR